MDEKDDIIMEDAVNEKVIEVSEKVLLFAFKMEIIRDTDIRSLCKKHNVGYNQVFNMVRPYLEEIDDRLFEKQNMRYRLNQEGCKYVPSGMWNMNAKKSDEPTENKVTRIIDFAGKHWKEVLFVVTVIAGVISAIVAINTCVQASR